MLYIYIHIQTYDMWVGVRMVDSIKHMVNFLCAKMMVKHWILGYNIIFWISLDSQQNDFTGSKSITVMSVARVFLLGNGFTLKQCGDMWRMELQNACLFFQALLLIVS